MLKTKSIVGLLLTLTLGLNLACGLIDQTAEANKIVGEANALIAQDNRKVPELSKLFNDLLGSGLSTVRDLEAYKKENQAKFDQLTKLSGELEKSGDETAAKFDQASKLKLNEKYKQYLELKSQEHKKRTDSIRLVAPLAKSFLETKEIDKINQMLDDYNKNSEQLENQYNDLEKQSDKIAKDNPDLIK